MDQHEKLIKMIQQKNVLHLHEHKSKGYKSHRCALRIAIQNVMKTTFSYTESFNQNEDNEHGLGNWQRI